MTDRFSVLLRDVDVARSGRFPVSVEKNRLLTESFQATEGEPQVIRCAKALAHILDHAAVFIEPGELIVGNAASHAWGMELTHLWGTWPAEEVESLVRAGLDISPEDRSQIQMLNDYWRGKGLTARMAQRYDDERLWRYAQLGIVLPPFKSKEEGWGAGGMLGSGYGVRHEIAQIITVLDYPAVLKKGLEALVAAAEAELESLRLHDVHSFKKADQLRAIIIAHQAVIRFARRFSTLATELASAEPDASRRAELRVISEICDRVPAQPARSLHDALQSLWFLYLVLTPSNVISFGRMDQYLYPYYVADVEAGVLTGAGALELLGCFRIKDMQIAVTGGQAHRSKWAGASKWHNCTIGGVKADGSDATNELTYLILEAALATRTPHPTLTLRVHEGTPDRLLDKSMEVLSSGLGVPAFVGDASFMAYLALQGLPGETARDYSIAGCNSACIAGDSRLIACPMFLAPRVLEIALNGGVDPRTGEQVGPSTGRLEDLANFEQLLTAFKLQLRYFMSLQAEFNNVTMRSYGELFPQPIESALMVGGIESGEDILARRVRLENGNGLNPIGLVNVADALAAIKKLVFDDRVLKAAELERALDADWEGVENQRIRRLCLDAPKFGNDDDYVDLIARDLYQFWANEATQFGTVFGGCTVPSALTIGTSPVAGGALIGATPDGRKRGEPVADASMGPMQHRDAHGVYAVIASALKIDQDAYQSTELDLKFNPDTLATSESRHKVSMLIKSYLVRGGKHVQLNVIGNEELHAAQDHPEEHRDTLVRVGGYSAYFSQLPRAVQNQVIARTEYDSVETRERSDDN